MATPTIVQSATGFAGAGNLAPTVTLGAGAGAGHAVVLCAAGDKNAGSFALDQDGDVDVALFSASVSLVLAWYVAAGGETTISGDWGANIAGGNLFALELEQDSDVGDWQLVAVGSAITNETNVTSQSTGTTGAAIADGLAIAAVACDSVNTAGTPSWSNGYTARYSSGDGSTQAGLWVATNPVSAAATTTTTLTRAGGTSDQHSGGVIVLGKVFTPPVDEPGVPFLVEDLGADAVLLVEIAFGADVLGDPDVWPWTDVTTDVRTSPAIETALGRGDEASTSQPATLSFVLDNSAGTYALTGEGPHWPYVRQGTPVRVSIDPDDLGGSRVVLLGFAASWVPGWDDLGGRIPTVALTAAGTLRRLEQGAAPAPSALRRALALLESTKAYWPMEDGRDAVVFAAVEGGQDMTYTGEPRPGSGADVFNCSGPIVDAGTAAFTANVTPFPATGECQVRFLIQVPEDGLDDGTVLAYVWTTGTLLRWDIVYSSAGSGNLGLYIYNADGSLNHSEPSITFDMNGKDRRMSLELVQDGGNVDWTLGVIQPSDLGAGIFDGTITGKTFLTVSQVQLAPLGGCSGVLFGHLTVQDEQTSLYEASGPLQAYAGEVATTGSGTGGRLGRLCSENGLALDRIVPVTAGFLHDGDRMGPQLPAPLLDLLREAETSDQGQIWDGRHAGLTYTIRRYRENIDGTAALTLTGAQIAAGSWSPTHDDQRIRNKVTVTRLQGVSATVEDVSGRRGTAAVGTYDEALTVNCRLDSMATHHAGWQVLLGTQEGYRVPVVSVDLRAAPALAGAVLDVVPGDRIDLEDLDDTFAGWGASDGLLQLIVEGIAHSITPTTWVATFQCSPFSPWGVAEFAAETGDTDPLVWRLDTDGSTLGADRAAGSTSLSVVTASGPLWTTTSDDYPLYLSVGGIKVRATACSGTSSPQTMTVDALPVARSSGAPIALWDPRPIGL